MDGLTLGDDFLESIQHETMSDLASICSDCGVPVNVFNSMSEAGWTSAKFAVGISSANELDDASVLAELGIDVTPSRVERAALKVAWKRCIQMEKSTSDAAMTPVQRPAISSSSAEPSEGSWSESFAPKLTSTAILQMKQRFQKSYPSEILCNDSMPSQRLLALVAHNISKAKWKWVPWKFRMSMAKEEDVQTSRSAKVPKIEGINLHALLMDDPPSIDVTGGNLGLHAIRTMFEVFNNAVAMCEAAHLASLKSYTAKFMTYLTAKYETDSNLRAPTFLEAQAADKQIHAVICELVVERAWSLDQALHELTSVRADLPMLLQPRPKPVKTTAPVIHYKGPTKGPGKGKSDFTKGKGKGKHKAPPRVEWVTEITQNGHKRQLCMRYQTGGCSLGDSCRFLHACAYPKDGKACGGSHSAKDHRDTPH